MLIYNALYYHRNNIHYTYSQTSTINKYLISELRKRIMMKKYTTKFYLYGEDSLFLQKERTVITKLVCNTRSIHTDHYMPIITFTDAYLSDRIRNRVISIVYDGYHQSKGYNKLLVFSRLFRPSEHLYCSGLRLIISKKYLLVKLGSVGSGLEYHENFRKLQNFKGE